MHKSNSWAYTRLGHITNQRAEEMAQLLRLEQL